MMRRIFSLLAVSLSVITLYAQGGTVEKSVDFRTITALDISSVFEVELTKASRQSVRLEYSEELAPYLIAETSGGKLELSFSMSKMDRQLRRKINRNGINGGNGSYVLKAYISVPSLSSIETSGAAEVRSSGLFQAKDLSVDICGASSVSGLEAAGQNLSVEVSGAGRFSMPSADFAESRLDLNGAATVSLAGTYNRMSLQASGASELYLSGKAVNLDIEASGAASVSARELDVDEVSINGSGAANITVRPEKLMEVSMSGACTISYPKGVPIKVISFSRGCNIDTY